VRTQELKEACQEECQEECQEDSLEDSPEVSLEEPQELNKDNKDLKLMKSIDLYN